jgi:hypothetical protein
MQDVADAVSLSGRVLDNDGNPVAGAIVVLLGVNQDGAYQTTTAADGTYQFSGVSLGSYQLYANIGQVTIAQEDFVLDGSSPTEVKDLPMDQTTSFAGSVYGLWNSFFGMQNIVEVHNKGSEMLTAVLSIYGLGGVAPFPDSHMVVNFKVRAGEKIDIILNSLGQFENNRYGYIKITGSHGDFDGGVSMYGPEADGSGDFAFSVYTPFRTTLSNNSYLLYNTFAPGTLVDSELLTPNWLALVNLEDSQQKFQVRYYSATGQVFGVSTIVATANSRVDLDGGHIVAGARQVGFIEVVPPSAKANYLASLMRYSTTASGQTPRSATLIPAVYAGSSTHYLPLTVLDRTQSVVEIANLSDTSNQIQLTWYNAAGSYVDSDSFSMRAHSVIHVPCGTYLTSSSSGMLRVAGAANSSIAVQMMVYHYSADWSLESVQYSSGVEGVSQRLTGAYNLYLGMANWLRIMNITDVALRVQIGIDALANPTTIVLPAHARRDIALHELDIPLNSYGQFTLQASTAGAIAAELVRAKQGETGVEFLATVPVR